MKRVALFGCLVPVMACALLVAAQPAWAHTNPNGTEPWYSYVVSNPQRGSAFEVWKGWTNKTAGPATLTCQVKNASWSNTFSVGCAVTAGAVSASVGYSVTASNEESVTGEGYKVKSGYFGWVGYADCYYHWTYTVKRYYHDGGSSSLDGTFTGTARQFRSQQDFYHYQKKGATKNTPDPAPFSDN